MATQDDEERELRSVALQNAQSILLARQRAERELIAAKEALEHKAAELAGSLGELREQREWFRVTLSSIGDAVITTDMRGSITFLNPVAELLTGWQFQDALGQPVEIIFNIINETTLQRAENPIEKVLRDGVVVGLANHTALIARNGKQTAIEDSAAPIKDPAGKVSGAVMVFHDVTRRRRAEDALRASEERLRAMFNHAAVGIAVARLGGQFLEVNNKFADILGYSVAELQQQTFTAITHPEDLIQTQVHLRRLIAGEISQYALEKRYLRKDSGIVWSLTTVTLLKDLHGEPINFLGIIEDITERKRAQDSIRESTERLQLALAAADLGDWKWDKKADRMWLSARAAEIFGLTGDKQFIWEELRDLLVEEDRERARVAVEYALANRSDYNIEYCARLPSGEYRWIATRGRGIYAGDGTVLGMNGVLQDITERKLAEERRSHLAAVVEFSDDAIVSKSLEGVITSWNAGARRMFGYEANETIGKSITILIPPERIEEETEILSRLRRGEPIEHYETERMRKNGTRLQVALTVSPIKDLNGKLIGASKIARDITLQKRAEEALRDESRILELLNETGTAIAGQLDLQTLVQTVTDSATQLSGAKFGAFFYNVINAEGESFLLYTLSGVARESFEKFGLPRNTPIFDPTFRGEGVVRVADITKDPRYGTMAPHHGMPKGHLPVCSYLAAPVISRSGKVIGGLFFGHPQPNVFTEKAERLIVGVAAQAAVAIDNARLYEAAQREIARRERAEDALREADRRKDEFLATLAHELRNPLAPIRQAALIAQAASATEIQKSWSQEVIGRQVQNMSLLLDDLLDISRITRGMLEVRKCATELASVVEAAVETAQPAFDAKQHVLTIQMPPEPVHLTADPLRLAQVLSNLLTNAAKYTDAPGQIRLSVVCDSGWVAISVTDTGIGISSEALPKIFDMFSQVKATQDRSDGGLGIGLALAKGLIELHGGTIEARSSGLGRGSEFTVRLPLGMAAARPQREPDRVRPRQPYISRKVLIADDNHDAAQSLAALLRIEAHEVRVTYNGQDALETFAEFNPACVLLDIGMPGLDGYEVARRIRQSADGATVKLIAVTGWGQERDKARALEAGFDHHFTKPLDPLRVMELLRGE